MAENTQVSTDARVPNIQRAVNLINTGGASSNNQVLRVKINGRSHFVQVRLHADGGYAAVAVQRNEVQRQVTKSRSNPSGIETETVDRPWVLFTVDKDGKRTYGGKGRTHRPTQEGNVGNLLGDNLPFTGTLSTTTEAQALAQAGTATINGEATTLDQFQNMVLAKARVLGNSSAAKDVRKQNTELGTGLDAFVPAVTPTSSPVPLQTIPHSAEEDGQVDPVALQPGNNDDNVLQQGVDGAIQLGSAAGDKIKEFLPGIGEFISNLKLSDQEIADFEALFEGGSGDTINGGVYPLDNTYGDIRGQDYVTIDQFAYRPPRRDSLVGSGAANPIQTLINGQQRTSPLKQFIAQVKLPMPNDIQDSNEVSWGADQMNNMSAAITAGVMKNPALVGGVGMGVNLLTQNPGLAQMAALLATGMDNNGIDGDRSPVARSQAFAKIMQSNPGSNTLFKSSLGSMILGAMGVNVTPESLLARGFGVIPNSNVELLFNNIKLRTFSFSWRMSPRNEREAREVKKIIRFFKQGMAAKTMTSQAGKASLYLGSPNVFRMQYRTARGEIIEGVNRMKPVAVTSTSVQYTPDGQWAAYDKGQPVSSVLTIGMSELEPVYASDYSQNVIGSRRSGEDTFETRSFEETETVFDGGEETSETRTVSYDVPVGEGDLYKIRPTEVGY